MSRPSKPWRTTLPSLDGPTHKPYTSEAAVRAAGEAEKATTSANRITIEKWSDGHWGEWLCWVRTGNEWTAQ
ncbi:hypothetical protein [Streptomyces sp. sk2.1]|uniref:hypothetical protein n=1 Tax=Streptomyces sp. sk2.1 TaxID=2478959 RepID=UPI0011E788C2|nr:hypothetical protein [Streptomyces sp. sk2.1]TXS68921.1 hypothetical protein EAO76_26510 [Streptomyces sp. sk2.1]